MTKLSSLITALNSLGFRKESLLIKLSWGSEQEWRNAFKAILSGNKKVIGPTKAAMKHFDEAGISETYNAVLKTFNRHDQEKLATLIETHNDIDSIGLWSDEQEKELNEEIKESDKRAFYEFWALQESIKNNIPIDDGWKLWLDDYLNAISVEGSYDIHFDVFNSFYESYLKLLTDDERYKLKNAISLVPDTDDESAESEWTRYEHLMRMRHKSMTEAYEALLNKTRYLN